MEKFLLVNTAFELMSILRILLGNSKLHPLASSVSSFRYDHRLRVTNLFLLQKKISVVQSMPKHVAILRCKKRKIYGPNTVAGFLS